MDAIISQDVTPVKQIYIAPPKQRIDELYEQYLLLPWDQFSKPLIKNTNEYYFFTFLQLLNQDGYTLTEKDLSDLEQFKSLNTEQSKEIYVKALFKQVECLNANGQQQEKNDIKIKEILQKITNEIIGVQFNYSAPKLPYQKQTEMQINSQLSAKTKSAITNQVLNDLTLLSELNLDLLSQEILNKLIKDKQKNIIYPLLERLNMSQVANSKGFIQFLVDSMRIIGEISGWSKILNILTLEQLEQLIEKVPKIQKLNVCHERRYLKKFSNAFEKVHYFDQVLFNKFEYIKFLKSIYDWSKTLPVSFKSFQDQIMIETFTFNIKYNIFDMELFNTFLDNPYEKINGLNEEYEEQIQKQYRKPDPYWHNVHRFQRNEWLSSKDIVERHLEYYFESTNSLDRYFSYFGEKYIKYIQYQCMLQQGKEPEEFYKLFSKAEIDLMTQKKQITFCSHNKSYFKHGESVDLKVELKNIPQLTVQVFKLNLENYFLDQKREIDQLLNLDGLYPLEEMKFEYKEPPMRKLIKEFTFDIITKTEKGFFIIEFIGNGLRNRALIKKGALTVKEKLTIAGHSFQILDENFNICIGEKTGMWIENRFFSANSDGEVIIPYGQQQQQFQSILVHDKFAEIHKITIQKETYQLACAFIVLDEQLVLDAQAQIMLYPKLFVNGSSSSLNLFKSFKVSIDISYESNVQYTKQYDNLVISDNKPIIVDFAITQNIKSVQINCKGEIDSISQKNSIILRKSHTIYFNKEQNTWVKSKFFLKYNSVNGYEIYLLGKNGEAIPNTDINITLRYFDFYQQQNQILTTDITGKIILGELETVQQITFQSQGIQSVTINIPQKDISKTGLLGASTITVLTDEQIKIPYCQDSSQEQATLLEKSVEGKDVLQNYSHLIKIDKQFIKFQIPKPGQYELTYCSPRTQKVSINVIEGQNWQDTNLIQTDDTLYYQVQNMKNAISIQTHEVKESENNFEIKGQIVNFKQNKTQIIAIAQTFVQGDQSKLYYTLEEIMKSQKNQSKTIKYQKNIFQNNQTLTDDQTYVHNRNSEEQYVGNDLAKPQLLLNRQFIRDTRMDEEKEIDFDQQKFLPINQIPEQSNHEIKKVQENTLQTVTTYQNFLKNPAQLITNIKVNNKGIFNFTVDKCYSFIQVIVFNSKHYSIKTIPLNNTQIETRDLRYKSEIDINKSYSIEQTIQLIDHRKAQQLLTKSFSFNLIDSFESLFLMLKQLRGIYSADSEQEQGFLFWSFLIKWNTFSIEYKNQLYEDYQSDELNMFLYFKDYPYFQVYVKDHLRHKLEKNFMDHYVLEDEQYLLEMSQVPNIDRLNGLELALLVVYLVEKKELKNEAKEILEYMKLKHQDLNNRLKENFFEGAIQAQLTQSDELIQLIKQNQQMVQKEIKSYRVSQSSQAQGDEECSAQLCSAQLCYGGSLQPSSSATVYKKKKSYQSLRKGGVQKFENLEKTKEYQERHCMARGYTTVPINHFWIDLATYSVENGYLNQGFFSKNFIYCAQSHIQMIGVLSLLDIFNTATEQKQELKQEDPKQLEKPTILFLKELNENKVDLQEDFLVVQKFYEAQNRQNEEVDEFLVNTIYKSEIKVVNCSAVNRDISVLIEIPNGSIPIYTPFERKQFTTTLNSYGFYNCDFYFYFPSIGNFTVYPASVTSGGVVIAKARIKSLQVSHQKTKINQANLDEILAYGSQEDLFKYLETQNIFDNTKFQSHKILYLLKNEDQYYKITQILRKRKYTSYDIWSFSLYHNHQEGIKEFLKMANTQSVLQQKAKYLSSSLIEYPELVPTLEYSPYIIQRSHKLDAESDQILNVEFAQQYKIFLHYLAQKKNRTIKDNLTFTYYLLLQNRIKEANQFFQKIEIDPDSDGQLQFDYFTAYFDFYFGGPDYKKAREISQKYLNYPSIHWRNLFYEIINQLSEYDQEENGQIELDDCQLQQNQQSESNFQSEQLETTIEGNNIVVTHANIEKLKIEFYQIDVETLFTQAPFMEVFNRNFSYIQPTFEMTYPLPLISQMTKTTIPVPDNLRNHNLFISFKGKEKISSNRYFSTTLSVSFYQDQGYLRVSDSLGKWLPKVYVKVYCRSKNGKMTFYKDGYTDIRGKFNYASMNVCQMNEIQKFSLYVESIQLGCLITEIEPPSILSQWNQNIQLISKNWNEKAAEVEGNLETQYEQTKEQFKQKQRKIY